MVAVVVSSLPLIPLPLNPLSREMLPPSGDHCGAAAVVVEAAVVAVLEQRPQARRQRSPTTTHAVAVKSMFAHTTLSWQAAVVVAFVVVAAVAVVVVVGVVGADVGAVDAVVALGAGSVPGSNPCPAPKRPWRLRRRRCVRRQEAQPAWFLSSASFL